MIGDDMPLKFTAYWSRRVAEVDLTYTHKKPLRQAWDQSKCEAKTPTRAKNKP